MAARLAEAVTLSTQVSAAGRHVAAEVRWMLAPALLSACVVQVLQGICIIVPGI